LFLWFQNSLSFSSRAPGRMGVSLKRENNSSSRFIWSGCHPFHPGGFGPWLRWYINMGNCFSGYPLVLFIIRVFLKILSTYSFCLVPFVPRLLQREKLLLILPSVKIPSARTSRWVTMARSPWTEAPWKRWKGWQPRPVTWKLLITLQMESSLSTSRISDPFP